MCRVRGESLDLAYRHTPNKHLLDRHPKLYPIRLTTTYTPHTSLSSSHDQQQRLPHPQHGSTSGNHAQIRRLHLCRPTHRTYIPCSSFHLLTLHTGPLIHPLNNNPPNPPPSPLRLKRLNSTLLPPTILDSTTPRPHRSKRHLLPPILHPLSPLTKTSLSTLVYTIHLLFFIH